MTKNLILIALASCAFSAAPAAITYSAAGSVYSQNFDSLASTGAGIAWSNNSTLPEWHWAVSNAPPTNYYTPTTYSTSDGAGPLQSVPLSLGTSGEIDRALGGQNGNNGGQLIVYGFSLSNQSGAQLQGFNLTYAGEQWRAITQATPYGVGNLQLEYQVFASGAGSLQAVSGWNNASQLAYYANYVPAVNSQVNGNQAAYRSVITGSVQGMQWNVGQELWLRWVDNNPAPDNSNNAALSMIGIDDVKFSAFAVPEPNRACLIGGALMGLLAVRRRRQG